MPLHPLNIVSDFLKKLSYKPGWKIKLQEKHDTLDSFDVIVTYEGYESENAGFDPLCFENSQVSRAREVMSRSIGKGIRRKQHYCYFRTFYKFDLERMNPEAIIKYVIGETIKQAEMYEFDRWFKYEGTQIFGENRGEIKLQAFDPPPMPVPLSYTEYTRYMDIEVANNLFPNTPIPEEKS